MRNNIQVIICNDINPYDISATRFVFIVCDICGINVIVKHAAPQ